MILDRKNILKKDGVERPLTELLLAAVIIVMMIYLTLNNPNFMSFNNFRNIFDQLSSQLILSIGMTFVVASRGIDLSVGSMVSFCGIVIGLLITNGFSLYTALLLTLLAGSLLGYVNGKIITQFNLAPFVVTIGTLNLFRGLTLVMTKGQPIYGFPKEFTIIGKGNYGEINPPIVISLALFLFAYLIIRYTKWGHYLQVIGSNELALFRGGINTKRYKISAYIVSGLCSALVGIIIASRLNAAEPNAGLMMESDVIAAVILGGTSMKGGKANIIGTFLASFLISIMKNGLTLLSISSYYQQFFIGLIILFSVIVSEIRKRRINY